MRVEHQPDENRYVLLGDTDDDVVGLADYTVRGDDIVITHTETDPARRGQGLGGQLVRGTLDDIRSGTSYRVVPQCPFVGSWIAQHPDYADLTTR
jgi:uncharacterized protein